MNPTTSRREQFCAFVEDNLDKLYRTALRLTRNPHDAQDLVADTVSRALQSIDNLQDFSRIGAWMSRIMTNHYISEHRKTASPAYPSCVDLLPCRKVNR